MPLAPLLLLGELVICTLLLPWPRSSEPLFIAATSSCDSCLLLPAVLAVLLVGVSTGAGCCSGSKTTVVIGTSTVVPLLLAF